MTTINFPSSPSVNDTYTYGGKTWTYNATGWALTVAGLEATANKDASGGYVGLTLMKHNFWNAAKTFLSFFTNTNTAARTYTFQDRDGTIADNTDLALKANLTANTFTAAQVLSDQQVSRAMLIDCGVAFVDKGNSGTSAQTLDYTAGSHQKLTVTGAFTLATSNWPPTGNLGEMLLELVNGAAFAVTWPTVNWVKSDGTVTTTFSSNGVTLQASGTDFCLLWCRDAGTTVYGKFMR